MTTKQKIHQANLSKWASLCKEQAASGLTIKNWCEANDISIHAYNYWKHQLKLAVVEASIPDIVPLATIDVESSVIDELPPESCDSHDSYNTVDTAYNPKPNNVLSISFCDIRIEVGSTTPDTTLNKIIEVLRHA